MTGNAVQFRHDDADVLRARRSGYSQQLLDGFTISKTIGYRRDVVHAIERRNKLSVSLIFTKLFNTAMEISDHALRIDDTLTVQLQLDLQHPVRGRMLRSHADGQFAGIKKCFVSRHS